jgi:hypothetical protein
MDRLEFANRYNFVKELGEALSRYFSHTTYSNHINFFLYGGLEIYDWRLAVMMVRNHRGHKPENMLLVLTRKEHALSKDCWLFSRHDMKEIKGTDFYAQLVEIPDEHKRLPPYEHNVEITPGMKNFLTDSFEPKSENQTLEESLASITKWKKHGFETQTVFTVNP